MTNESARTVAIVVTYNRRELLIECLAALLDQTSPLAAIVVVDNASTDGTQAALDTYRIRCPGNIIYVKMEHNTGGAGGFARGVSEAMEIDCDWLWLMDDDAVPQPDALASLFLASPAPSNVYASTACRGNELSWAVSFVGASGHLQATRQVTALPPIAEVSFFPFIGFLIHKKMVATIGLPDAAYFISADDVEYSLRARAAGAKLLLVEASRIDHPIARAESRNVLGRRLIYLSLAPWRRYYDTRNRLLVARNYYGIRFWTEAIPGTLARFFLAFWLEADRWLQMKATMAGFLDGIRGIKGVRHTYWRIDR